MKLFLLLPLIFTLVAVGSISNPLVHAESVDVDENKMVTLVGEGYDADNEDLIFQWTQISGEPVNLSSISSTTPSFTSPTVANGEIKVLVFELKVYDDNGRQAVDTVKITVDPINSTPEATASAKQS